MDWNKLGKSLDKQRADRQAEEERLAVDPGPPLEARAVDGIRDWTKSIGVLYGTPTKVGDGWGIAIYPTRQQDALIEQRRHTYNEAGRYDDGYLVGLDAASIDKNGHVRTLTISEPRGFAYDMNGNIHCRCKTTPRAIEAVGRTNEPPGPATGHENPNPPKAPGSAREYTAAQERQRSAPAQTR